MTFKIWDYKKNSAKLPNGKITYDVKEFIKSWDGHTVKYTNIKFKHEEKEEPPKQEEESKEEEEEEDNTDKEEEECKEEEIKIHTVKSYKTPFADKIKKTFKLPITPYKKAIELIDKKENKQLHLRCYFLSTSST